MVDHDFIDYLDELDEGGEATAAVWSRRRFAPTPPDGAVYVGRPTQFGNPFIVGRDGTHERVVELYRDWLLNDPNGQVIAERARRELRGKHLVCWCTPLACHADVLLEIANG